MLVVMVVPTPGIVNVSEIVTGWPYTNVDAGPPSVGVGVNDIGPEYVPSPKFRGSQYERSYQKPVGQKRQAGTKVGAGPMKPPRKPGGRKWRSRGGAG